MEPVVVGDYAEIQTGGWERANGTLPGWLEILTDGWFRASAEIITQPISQEVEPGSDVSLFVEAVGFDVLSYQWKKNGVIIVGETSDTYLISSFDFDDTGAYSVEVTCDGATIESDHAVLTLLEDDPELISLYRGLGMVKRLYEPCFFESANEEVLERNGGGLPLMIRYTNPMLPGYEEIVINTYSGTNIDTVKKEIRVSYVV